MGVREPALQNALVAGDHDLGFAAVGDEGEARALEGEVALVRLHRRLDHARRQLQVTLVEAPFEHHGALDEEDDLLEHARGIAPAADRVEPLEDLSSALVLLRLDAGGAEHLDVLVGPRHLDLAAGKAVAVGQVAGLEPRHLHLQRGLVELRAQPADRSGEAQATLLPEHRLERKALDDGGELLGQRLRDGPTRHDDAQEAVAQLEILLVDALLAGETRRRLLAQVLGRPLHPAIRLALGDLGHEESEPARPDIDASPQLRKPALAELRLGLAARGGRQLFAADLKQQARQGTPRRARPRAGRGCGRDRCSRRARSPRSPRAHRGG